MDILIKEIQSNGILFKLVMEFYLNLLNFKVKLRLSEVRTVCSPAFVEYDDFPSGSTSSLCAAHNSSGQWETGKPHYLHNTEERREAKMG